MKPTGLMDRELESLSWDFLESEFTGPIYAGWPIDRRLEIYLLRRGLTAVANNGNASVALLERVMTNIGPALRRGVLDRPKYRNPS